MGELRRLWSGEMPLVRAFWVYAATVGIALNLATSTLFLVLLTADRPLAALAAGYFGSVPYNVVVTVGVWRAADRHQGDRTHAVLARFVTLVGMALLTVT